MQAASIGMIAAMPEEIKPLLNEVGAFNKERVGEFNIYRLTIGGRAVCLVESGMGPRNAAMATRILIETATPELIISFGFAGSLSPQLKAGDIVVANRLLFLHERLFSEQQGVAGKEPTNIKENQTEFKLATFVTTYRIAAKKQLAAQLPAGTDQAVVEMESSAVARVCRKEKIPFVAVRAISDGFEEELGFSMDELCDRDLNLKKRRVLLTVARKPWIIPQLVRLSVNSRNAGQNLAKTLCRIIPTLHAG